MKNRKLYLIHLITISLVSVSLCHAVEHTQWQLPEDAIYRFGKGVIRDIAYFPDGNRVAVSSSIGVWVYDTHTGDELALLTEGVHDYSAIAFSPNGEILACASENYIQLWEIEDYKLQDIYTGHTSEIQYLVYSNSGKTLISGSTDTTIRVWDTATGEVLSTLVGLSDRTSKIAISADGTTIASSSFSDIGKIRMYNLETGEYDKTITTNNTIIYELLFLPDGSRIAAGDRNGDIHIWDMNSGEFLKKLSGEIGYITSLDASKNGLYLLCGSSEEIIQVWAVEIEMLINTYNQNIDSIAKVTFSPDGRTFSSASIGEGTIHFWDLENGNLLRTISGHTNYSRSVVFSPDGQFLATTVMADDTVNVRNVDTGEIHLSLKGHTQRPYSLAYSQNGEILASGSYNGQIILWDMNTGNILDQIRGHRQNVSSLSLIPNGNNLVSGGWDSIINFWNFTTGANFQKIPINLKVRDIAISPDGNILASATDEKTVRLWDTNTGESKGILEGHRESAECVTFSPIGNLIATGSNDNTIKIWDLNSGELRNTFSEPTNKNTDCVAFSPDGYLIASSSLKVIRIWDVMTGKIQKTLTGHTTWVRCVQFSPDGRMLASSSSDGTVLLWDVSDIPNVNNR